MVSAEGVTERRRRSGRHVPSTPTREAPAARAPSCPLHVSLSPTRPWRGASCTLWCLKSEDTGSEAFKGTCVTSRSPGAEWGTPRVDAAPGRVQDARGSFIHTHDWDRPDAMTQRGQGGAGAGQDDSFIKTARDTTSWMNLKIPCGVKNQTQERILCDSTHTKVKGQAK